MSFTTEVKEELSRVAPGCSHCENATLAALIRIEGTLLMKGQGRYALEIATDSPVVARFIIKALHENYHLTTDLTMRRSVLHKTPNWLIEVPMQPGLNETLKELGILGEDGLERGIDPALIAKQCCAAAYLRGVFLGSGFISNPRGDFHFELKVETEATANAIVELLKERGIKARAIQRRNSYLIYLKSGTAISSFLALVGAHQSALKMENERVVKSVRNDVVAKAKAGGYSFLDAVRAGAFTVPGDGDFDFQPVFDILAENGYEGWVVVEAEQDPAKANPFEYAVMAREYIRRTEGL